MLKDKLIEFIWRRKNVGSLWDAFIEAMKFPILERLMRRLFFDD